MFDAFDLLATIELAHDGDCHLRGLTPEGLIFVEELYGEDDWLAQHKLSASAGIIESVDEGYGSNQDVAPMRLPADIMPVSKRGLFEHLNFCGARSRGLATSERVEKLVRSISVAEKIAMTDFMGWDVDPMRLTGIAESTILSTSAMTRNRYVVCRRIRVICRLPRMQTDRHGFNYDYESLPIHLVHDLPSTATDLPDLGDCLQEVDFCRPLDCIYALGKLYVADGGDGDVPSAVHVFAHNMCHEVAEDVPSAVQVSDAVNKDCER